MTSKFANKSADEIAEDIFLNTNDAGDVDAAFKSLKSVSAAIRKEAVDILEKALIEDTRGLAEEFKELGPLLEMFGGLGDMFPEDPTEEEKSEDAEDLNDAHTVCKMFLHVNAIKGEEAHPVTKSIVQELSTLSDVDYNSIIKLTVAVTKAVSKADAAEIANKTPNPFKKGPKGPGL